MKKFMDWLTNSFAPKANALFGRPWITGVSSAMQKILPFILTGSVIFFYNVFRSYVDFLPDLGPIASYSFFLIGLITAFMMGYQIMQKLNISHYSVTAGIVAISLLLMFVYPGSDTAGNMVILNGRLGPSGILVGMVAGIVTAIIFRLYSKLHVLENNVTLPDFVSEWINNVIPIIVTLSIGMVLTVQLKMDVYAQIEGFFMPLQVFGQTLPGLILLVFVPAFFYTMGISTWLFAAVQTPIFLAGIEANIKAVAAGLPATNIVTNETIYTLALIMMGGTGATLLLNVLMLRSKSKKLKTMGRICIGPSLFNINEPLVFGAPIVFNPLLMLPMWICSIIGPTIIWCSMYFGLLNIPAKLYQVAQVPAPINSVIVTEDIRAVLWYVVLFIVYLAIWYPFFKVYEKQCILEEQGKD
jgi:PTS system cellobiose-specific IIC component